MTGGAGNAAVLAREARRLEEEARHDSDKAALRDALEAGACALRLMGQWEDFTALGEEEE